MRILEKCLFTFCFTLLGLKSQVWNHPVKFLAAESIVIT